MVLRHLYAILMFVFLNMVSLYSTIKMMHGPVNIRDTRVISPGGRSSSTTVSALLCRFN